MTTIRVYDECGEVLAESNNWVHALQLVEHFTACGCVCYARKA